MSLLESLLLGFAVTAVPGAVFFETVRRSLHEEHTVIRFLAGNFIGMLVIIAAAFMGLSTLPPDSLVATLFYVASGLLLILIGLSSIFKRKEELQAPKSNTSKTKIAAFSLGIMLAVANPLSIAFWISLSAKLMKDAGNISVAILNCLCVVLGAALLFALLISLVRLLKSKIKTDYLVLLSRVVGVAIFGYGVVFLAGAF